MMYFGALDLSERFLGRFLGFRDPTYAQYHLFLGHVTNLESPLVLFCTVSKYFSKNCFELGKTASLLPRSSLSTYRFE